MNIIDSEPSIDFVLLADRAEAINGKLYVMGGGWDRLWLTEFPKAFVASIAIGVIVPWSATHTDHRLCVLVVTADETEIANAQVTFAAGASPQMKRGESQRILVAFTMSPTFPGPGTYKVKALIDDDEDHRRETVFYVNHKLGTPKQ